MWCCNMTAWCCVALHDAAWCCVMQCSMMIGSVVFIDKECIEERRVRVSYLLLRGWRRKRKRREEER